MMSSAVCAACRHQIDAAAKICPYCGANPATGERIDTQALLQEVFQPRTVTKSESVLEYARQRQGVVITVSLLVAFLLLAGIHQIVMRRNLSAVSDAPAVPLTEVSDLANQKDDAAPMTMPDLDFQYDGRPQSMRTFVVESGAVTPPEVIAAQQAAQQAAAAAAAAKNGAAVPAPAGAARPGVPMPQPGVVRPPQPQPTRPAVPQRPR
jgi:hypothetical protein